MFYGQEDWVLWIRKIRHQDSEEWFCTSKAIAQIMIVLLYANFVFHRSCSDAVTLYDNMPASDWMMWSSLRAKICFRPPKARRPQNWEPNDDPVVPLERNLYSYPLDGHLREKKVRNFCVRKDGRKSPDGSAYTFIEQRSYSCQCMLRTLRWQGQ